MARDKRIEVSGLISKRSSFERINEAFQDLEAGRNLTAYAVH
jgi:Zn-dependent alcohol dehydrogenase